MAVLWTLGGAEMTEADQVLMKFVELTDLQNHFGNIADKNQKGK